MCKLRPESRGNLRIRSTEPLAAPAIQVNYLADPRDLETMVAGVKLMRRITAAPALASIIACERDPGPECASDDEIAAFVRAKGISVYHPVGTCRMGPDEDAVVDPELRVRGVSGLRVVDASIMPTLVSGNTNGRDPDRRERRGPDFAKRGAGELAGRPSCGVSNDYFRLTAQQGQDSIELGLGYLSPTPKT